MFIPILSLFIGVMIILIPFMVMFFLIKKIVKKEEDNKNLELRIQLLEDDIRQIKQYIEFLEEM